VRVAPKKKKGMMAMKIGPITSLPAAAPAAAAPADAAADDASGSIGRREGAAAVVSGKTTAAAAASSASPVAAPVASSSSRRKAVDHSAEVAGEARYQAHEAGDEAAAAAAGPSSSADAMQTDGDGVVGPSRPPGAEAEAEAAEAESSDDDDEAGTDDDPYRVPLSNEISLKGHKKVVGAMAVDHSGSRVVSGSHDYHCRLFDFGGMKRDLKPFRTLDAPLGDHQIVALSFSPSGHQFLAVSGSCQAKVRPFAFPFSSTAPSFPHECPVTVQVTREGARGIVFGRRCLACTRHTPHTHTNACTLTPPHAA